MGVHGQEKKRVHCGQQLRWGTTYRTPKPRGRNPGKSKTNHEILADVLAKGERY